MAPNERKTLAIYSFSSCGGCQFGFFSQYQKLAQLSKYFEISQVEDLAEAADIHSFDVAIIFGSLTESQIPILRKIRAKSKIVIAAGACAHLGGIQSVRNILPQSMTVAEKNLSIGQAIKVDYTIPGCPINQDELIECLLDIYRNKSFNLPDLSVCFECKLNENKCLLKQNKPCLGPITRSGCNSSCTNKSETCLGCRGPLDQSNFVKLENILKPLLDEEEISVRMNYFGDYKNDFNNITKRD